MDRLRETALFHNRLFIKMQKLCNDAEVNKRVWTRNASIRTFFCMTHHPDVSWKVDNVVTEAIQHRSNQKWDVWRIALPTPCSSTVLVIMIRRWSTLLAQWMEWNKKNALLHTLLIEEITLILGSTQNKIGSQWNASLEFAAAANDCQWLHLSLLWSKWQTRNKISFRTWCSQWRMTRPDSMPNMCFGFVHFSTNCSKWMVASLLSTCHAYFTAKHYLEWTFHSALRGTHSIDIPSKIDHTQLARPLQ